MVKDSPNRREPFIASRNEPGASTEGRSEPQNPPKRPATVGNGAAAPVAGGAPRKSKFGVVVLSLIVCFLGMALAGLGAFSWQQSQSQQLLQQRFDEIALRLESTDESLSQSGAALVMKLNKQQESLDTLWTEVKKLWGVANDRNKKAIAALELANTDISKEIKKIQQAETSLQSGVKKVQAELVSISSASLAVSAQNDDFATQLQNLEARLKSLSGESLALQKLIEKNRQAQSQRFEDLEQGVKSMDAFRKQTNEKFNRLQSGAVSP